MLVKKDATGKRNEWREGKDDVLIERITDEGKRERKDGQKYLYKDEEVEDKDD